jgi:cytochrome c peroxidase
VCRKCGRACSASTTLGFGASLPYFHNGFAADLAAAVEFYEDRFQIGFTPQERSDLIAFLRTL